MIEESFKKHESNHSQSLHSQPQNKAQYHNILSAEMSKNKKVYIIYKH